MKLLLSVWSSRLLCCLFSSHFTMLLMATFSLSLLGPDLASDGKMNAEGGDLRPGEFYKPTQIYLPM